MATNKGNPVKYGNNTSSSKGTGRFGQTNMNETPKPSTARSAPPKQPNGSIGGNIGLPLGRFTSRVTESTNSPQKTKSAPKPSTTKASGLMGINATSGLVKTSSADKTTGRKSGSGKTTSRTVKQGVTGRSST